MKKILVQILVLHMVIGLVSTYRTWVCPTERVVGMSNSDLYPHLWGYWRWHRQFKTGWMETWSNAEPYLNAPYTGDLYHVDWLNAAIVSFFQSLHLPFLLSVNCMLLFQWALCAGLYPRQTSNYHHGYEMVLSH